MTTSPGERRKVKGRVTTAVLTGLEVVGTAVALGAAEAALAFAAAYCIFEMLEGQRHPQQEGRPGRAGPCARPAREDGCDRDFTRESPLNEVHAEVRERSDKLDPEVLSDALEADAVDEQSSLSRSTSSLMNGRRSCR
jgi:hypothetical protein